MNYWQSFLSQRGVATVIAAAAVLALITSVWLWRRRQKTGRGAAIVCLFLTIGLHAILFWGLPRLPNFGIAWFGDGHDAESIVEVDNPEADIEIESLAVSMIMPPEPIDLPQTTEDLGDDLSEMISSMPAPLPVASLLEPASMVDETTNLEPKPQPTPASEAELSLDDTNETRTPEELAIEVVSDAIDADLLSDLDDWLEDDAGDSNFVAPTQESFANIDEASREAGPQTQMASVEVKPLEALNEA
ncbi:MAG: hypothetical protein AAF664_18675, partial [Planctomycetota bacterium]